MGLTTLTWLRTMCSFATEGHVSLKGQNISTGRLYPSIPLANWLLDKNIITVLTLNSTLIGLPNELENLKEREEFSGTC